MFFGLSIIARAHATIAIIDRPRVVARPDMLAKAINIFLILGLYCSTKPGTFLFATVLFTTLKEYIECNLL